MPCGLSHFSQICTAHAHQIWKLIPVLKEKHLSFPYHAYYHRHVKLFISLKPDQSTSRFCSRRLRHLHSCDRKKLNFFSHIKKFFGIEKKNIFYICDKSFRAIDSSPIAFDKTHIQLVRYSSH